MLFVFHMENLNLYMKVITYSFCFSLMMYRMEKVNLRKVAGIAKALGILICIGGVITLAFYKGPYLKPLINHHLLKFHKSSHNIPHSSSSKTWIIGCFLLFISSISWGLWFVLQVVLPFFF